MKYGIYAGGELLASYEYTSEGYAEAIVDTTLTYEFNNVPIELKEYEV